MTERSMAADIEECIVALLRDRAPTASICPSDAARVMAKAYQKNWRDLMQPTREVAVRMALAGRLRITRRESTLDPRDLGRGPIRLRPPEPTDAK